MTRNEKKFYKLIKWAKSALGLKIKIVWFDSKRDYKWGGEYLNGSITMHCAKTKYINWTCEILDLAHEIGHHLDDSTMKKKELKAHHYVNDDQGKCIPHWARKVILKHELEANRYIMYILEQAGIAISKTKVQFYRDELEWQYVTLLSNKSNASTWEQTYTWRRANRHKYYKPYTRGKNGQEDN